MTPTMSHRTMTTARRSPTANVCEGCSSVIWGHSQPRRKEAEKVTVPDLPIVAAQYETWFFTAANTVASAALDADPALDWIYEVEDDSKGLNDFHKRGREASLDQKLLTALLNAATTGPNKAKHAVMAEKINKASRELRAQGRGQAGRRGGLWLQRSIR